MMENKADKASQLVIKKKIFIDKLTDFDGEIRSTCKALNIKECTYYAWIARDADFKISVEQERQRIEAERIEKDKAVIKDTINNTDDLYRTKVNCLNKILTKAGMQVDLLTPLIEATARAQAVEEMLYNKLVATGGDKQQTRLYLDAAKVANTLLEQCGLKLNGDVMKSAQIDDFNKVMLSLNYDDVPEIREIIHDEAERLAEEKIQDLQLTNSSNRSKRLRV